MFDASDFIANQNRFPWERLAAYQGQYVAWAADGKAILAAGSDLDRLFVEVERLALPSETYVIDYIDPEPRYPVTPAHTGWTGPSTERPGAAAG